MLQRDIPFVISAYFHFCFKLIHVCIPCLLCRFNERCLVASILFPRPLSSIDLLQHRSDGFRLRPRHPHQLEPRQKGPENVQSLHEQRNGAHFLLDDSALVYAAVYEAVLHGRAAIRRRRVNTCFRIRYLLLPRNFAICLLYVLLEICSIIEASSCTSNCRNHSTDCQCHFMLVLPNSL